MKTLKTFDWNGIEIRVVRRNELATYARFVEERRIIAPNGGVVLNTYSKLPQIEEDVIKFLNRQASRHGKESVNRLLTIELDVHELIKYSGGRLPVDWSAGDAVANTETKTVGFVLEVFEGFDVRTDADGVVFAGNLQKYDPVTHKDYQIAPSTLEKIKNMR